METATNSAHSKPVSVECGVMPPATIGREEQAVRWAVNRFEEWHNITNVPPLHTGYYYEVLSLIEDAARIGFGAAHGAPLAEILEKLDD